MSSQSSSDSSVEWINAVLSVLLKMINCASEEAPCVILKCHLLFTVRLSAQRGKR